MFLPGSPELHEWHKKRLAILFGPGTLYARFQAVAALGENKDPLEMSAAHVLSLLDRFPRLYREAWSEPNRMSQPFARDGFSCSDGWVGIIERLSEKLVLNPNLYVIQLKEKYGILTVYFGPSEPAPPEIGALTYAALGEAQAESERTCEECGQPGTIAKRGHQVSVRCLACEAEDRKRT